MELRKLKSEQYQGFQHSSRIFALEFKKTARRLLNSDTYQRIIEETSRRLKNLTERS
jgi:hypothetical protein